MILFITTSVETSNLINMELLGKRTLARGVPGENMFNTHFALENPSCLDAGTC
jgi:hypothetical protein